jgi:hypothetical protein
LPYCRGRKTETVRDLNRRQTEEFNGIPKVREVVVPDMNKLAEAVEPAAREAGATVGFCAIGVGKASQKMPEAEVRKIEVQYPEAFAKGCKAGGVLCMGLMTAAGADIKSSFTYVRIIGEKERAVSGVGIPLWPSCSRSRRRAARSLRQRSSPTTTAT